ncbi:cytochrome b/b6 domain-containing protein [Nocardioides sp. CER19]|uniref:cytochrome b/b6 domain-containing protein n=1 Tax=Nocardioides sp. CER19 TaxID=3038538 RepID=UPI0024484C4C|nr:cytochrome b/b6 domain-containing protein [Nocardioides sp. CER19]MDH2414388.1 cytochrome b/b6 domain-containing protein [Nocardioides sp. CER19]
MPETRSGVIPRRESPYVARFTRAERAIHYATAALFLFCIAAAACLYVTPLAHLVGRRHLVATVHEWAGVLIPVPVLLGLASHAFRRDLHEINRFHDGDREWLRAGGSDRRRGRFAGKFNAGQKLYASWIAGAVLIMVVTGLLLWNRFSLTWIPRSGVLFIHDIGFYLLGFGVAGHISKAVGDPEARRGMRTGLVRRTWARETHGQWLG